MERKVYNPKRKKANKREVHHRKKTKRGERKSKIYKSLLQYKNEDGTQKESKIEKKVRLFLEQEGYPYIQEYGITYKNRYKSYDFYISDGVNYTFLVEVHGDYWHAYDYHQGTESHSKLSKIQKKNLRNDKLKEKIAKEKGLPLLVIWETDIKRNFRKIKKELEKYSHRAKKA